jgi:guanine deaminase
LFPEARSYLDVYAAVGLLHAKSVFAHGIWLDDADRAQIAAAGAQIAHSPSSNLFLGSGLFGWRAAEAAGVASAWRATSAAARACRCFATWPTPTRSRRSPASGLTAWKALHAATRGAATALGLAGEIGSLDVGAAADFCVWDGRRRRGGDAPRRRGAHLA